MTDRSGRRKERGAVLAAVGAVMVLLVGMAAVGVDIGRLALTANEAQVVADASATAGALALADDQEVEPAALGVAGENTMAGTVAEPADMTNVLGTSDFELRQFVASEADPNAVSATAEREVTNVFAGIFGDPMSSVTRTAIAATGPASTGRATLPIALSDCHFPADCEDESCLPSLTQTPNGDDNSAFTGFFDNASGNVLESYIHPDCGGGGLDGPLVSVGEHISLNNGQVSNFMQGFECQVCELGITEYVVPIITHCDENFVSASPPGSGGSGNGLVYGFASITVDSFNYSNGCTGCCRGGAPQTVNLHAVIRQEDGFTGAGGPCTGCQVDGIALVQ
jgi:hypothetical protein